MGQEALLSSQIIGLAETIDDEVASLLIAGTGITLTYNDGAGTLTIASTVSPTWGSIGGTLSSQIDLQTALDGKSNAGHTHVIADTTGLQTALDAKLGGSTGATDNRILRADGTGGKTAQNSVVAIDDSGNVSGVRMLTVAGDGGNQGINFYNSNSQILLEVDYGLKVSNQANRLTINNGSPGSLVCGTISASALNTTGNIARKGSVNDLVRLTATSGEGTLRLANDVNGLAVEIWTSVQSNRCHFRAYSDVEFRCNNGIIIKNNGNTDRADLFARNIGLTGIFTVGTYTVATLPSAAVSAGALAQVTDSSVTANGSAVAGGGSNRVVVFSNGSTWDVVVA